MTIITEKILPHSLDAESAVISCMLQSPKSTMDAVFSRLVSDDYFFVPTYYTLSSVLREFYEARQVDTLDMVVFTDKLTAINQLEAVGGEGHLQTIYNLVPTTANLDTYLETVVEYYRQRQLVNAMGAAVNTLEQDGSANVIDVLSARLREIEIVGTKGSSRSLDDAAAETLAAYDELNSRGYVGLKTGFVDIDNITQGLRPGNMYVLAARPSLGKTSLAMDIARYVATQDSQPVGIFSLEMPIKDLYLRMACSYASLSLRSPKMADRIRDVVSHLRTLPIHIEDQPGLTIADLRYRAKQMKVQHGISLLIVDYLQLLAETHSNTAGNREQQVAHQSKQFKNLCRELDIPGILVCQLNRAAGLRGWPKMADLRESGAIEQDADFVGLLHRERAIDNPGDSGSDDPFVGQKTSLIIAKHRNGATGIVMLLFFAAYTQFQSSYRINNEEIPM